MVNVKFFSLRRIVSYLLSIIVVALLSAIIILINLNFTLLSKEHIKSQIEKTDYVNKTYNIILETCKNYNMQSGFDEAVIENAISIEDVKEDINKLVDSFYGGKQVEIDTSKINKKLDDNIEKYVQENNYIVNDETQEAINDFKSEIEKTYKRGIAYLDDFVKEISEPLKTAKTAIKIAIGVLMVIAIVLAIIIFKLNKAAIGIASLAIGGLFIILNQYSGTTVAINNILIFNRAFSDLIISVINQILHNMLITGIIFTIIGVIIIFVVELRKSYERKLLLEEHSQVIR